MRKRSRNPASKASSGLREKAKGGLPDGALALFTKLGLGDHFGSFHGSNPSGNRRDRGISLDPSMAATGGEPERQGDHFGSESLVDSSRRADPGGIEADNA